MKQGFFRGAYVKWVDDRKDEGIPKIDADLVCYVYFIQSCDPPNLIKIGRSNSVAKRMKALQSASPSTLKLIGLLVGPLWMEAALHGLFADLRQHGEWFTPDKRLTDFIERHKSGNAPTAEYMIEGFKIAGADDEMVSALANGYNRLDFDWRYKLG